MDVWSRAAAVVVIAGGWAAAWGGEPPEWRDRGHHRHEHPHNEDHASVVEPGRFTTNRESPVVLPLPGEEDAFFFVVFGDRTGGPVEGVAVLKDAVRDVNLLEPDLVMTVGDLINGYNRTDEWMEEMREFKGIMDGLICPWFPVAGNHDVYWRPLDDPDRPADEHEGNYELHFGPLWYAFEHKNCWFIALYSDEGNPETGERSISDPAAQRMSAEQLAWLEETLERAGDADHVFVFLHHPRWRGGNYGDDWEKVHEVLVRARNVSAVFGGHIHRMTYQQEDGIEYFSLATVGGYLDEGVPSAGWRHHYNIVTVRKDQIATAAYPVGAAMDPRELTDALTEGAAALARSVPAVEGGVVVEGDGAALGVVRVRYENPTAFEVEVSVTPESADSRWFSAPDHAHATVAAGGSREFEFAVGRTEGAPGAGYRDLEVVVAQELLTEAFRYPIPGVRLAVDADLRLHRPARPERERVLRVNGRDGAALVESGAFELPDGAFTLECWFRARGFGERVGLVAKTENSEYGIFVSNGTPEFSVLLGEAYAEVAGGEGSLSTGVWHHVAGVFDGSEVRLYVDGRRVAETGASGVRRTNRLPVVIGADVNGRGEAVSFFDGEIDGVRLSRGARYEGASFEPARRAEADETTVWAFNMDGTVGHSILDSSERAVRARRVGGAEVVVAE